MSAAEDLLALQIRASKLPKPEREVCLIEGRKYRWDFVWRGRGYSVEDDMFELGLALEVQGGIWRTKGAHNTGNAIMRDCEKACLAAIAGFRTMFVTPEHIKDGRALEWLKSALKEI